MFAGNDGAIRSRCGLFNTGGAATAANVMSVRHPDTCLNCDGNGRVEGLEHCPECKGSGLTTPALWRNLRAATQRAEAAERERDAIINAVRAKCAEIRDTGKHCRKVDHKYNRSCDCREITADVESVLSPPPEAPKP